MQKITQKTTLEQIKQLTHPCNCTACNNGCNHGSGVFTDEQIPKLAKHLNISEKELKEKYLEETTRFHTTKQKPKVLRKNNLPYGKCIFYKEDKGCTIHEVKPLECKLAMPCKDYGEDISVWFMLNQFVNTNDPESMREYETYLKTGGKKLEGADLKDLRPDDDNKQDERKSEDRLK